MFWANFVMLYWCVWWNSKDCRKRRVVCGATTRCFTSCKAACSCTTCVSITKKNM